MSVSKVKLEYVMSAVGGMGMFSKSVFENHLDILKPDVLTLMRILQSNIEKHCQYTIPKVSTLFNAYTEASFPPKMLTLGNLGAESLYADSGGLQMVTLGKKITPEIKQEIYRTQMISDFAMCFDEIPLEKTTTIQTINERSNTGNKIFNQANHGAAGKLTGLNIKEQSRAFRENKAKTKVIIIIQGNNAQDMMHYYQEIASQLNEEDYQNIGGMAVADTCIGNGELESIEMLRGARAISRICHPNIKKHLHILGVGSIARMRPILYLIKSGYLDTFDNVSYDSSSHTSTLRFGLLKLNGGCKPMGMVRTLRGEEHFAHVYSYFSDMLSPILTVDRFLDIILSDGKNPWSYTTIKKTAENFEPPLKVVAYLVSVMHTYFQIGNFISCLDDVFAEDPGHHAIGHLARIKTDADMNEWIRHHEKHVKTKRIKRKEHHADISTLWEN